MSHPILVSLAALLLSALVLTASASVSAQPQIPATYFGSATTNGANVPDGTAIRGFVNGQDCTQPSGSETLTDGGVSAYVIVVMHESQVEGCGKDGDIVSFTIGDEEANQTAEWSAGVVPLDLNAGTGSPVPLPTATTTPTVNPETATAQQALQTPPTDDPDVLNPTLGAPVQIEDDESSSSLLAWVIVILGVLAIAGAVGGWVLSRRKP